MHISRCCSGLIVLISVAAATAASAAPVTFQNPTAYRSQAGLDVGYAVDGLLSSGGNSGWGDAAGLDDNTAVFEAGTDFGFVDGTFLEFTLDSRSYNTHAIGKYRISTTTADRSLFADGLANGGDLGAPAIWTPLSLIAATSSGNATMSIESGNTVYVSGTNPNSDIHTVQATTNLTGITGIRLEALQDSRLPSNGPGRSGSNGNFVLTEFSLDTRDLSQFGLIGFQNATADKSQSSWDVGNILTDNTAGWAAANTGTGTPQTAALETVTDVGFDAGTTLSFDLRHRSSNQHNIKHFRLAVTTADRSLFADGLANGGDLGSPDIWTELVPMSVVSSGGSTVTINADNSVLMSGANPNSDIYRFTANTPLTDITGIRLETLDTPSGRYPTNGNYILSYFSGTAAELGSQAVNLAQSAGVTPVGGSSAVNSVAVLNDGVTTNDVGNAAFMLPPSGPQGQGFDLGGHATVDTVRLYQHSTGGRKRLESVTVYTSAGPIVIDGLPDQDIIDLDLGGVETSYVFIEPGTQQTAGTDTQIGILEIEVLTTGMGIESWENFALGAPVTLEGTDWQFYSGATAAGLTDGVTSWGPNLEDLSTSAFNTTNGQVVLDLGESHPINTFGIAQQTLGGSGPRRMIEDVLLEFSDDDFLTTSGARTVTLLDGVAYQQVEFDEIFGQYVRISPLTQYATGIDGRIGIIELQLFHRVPEPSSLVLLALGCIGLFVLRRGTGRK